MTSTLRKSGSFAAFTWAGAIADPRDQAFAEALATRRFRTIENAASEEVSVGWVTPEDPSGDTFDANDMDGGPGTWLRFRTDTKRLPKEWLQAHMAAAERARGKRLSARERRELKDDLMEKLLPRVLPAMRQVDALLFHDRRLVLLFSTSKAARESFGKLFAESFGVALDGLHPRGLALNHCGFACMPSDIDRLEPTRWPGGSSSASGDDPHAFMGEEFLLWLWWRWEGTGGEFTLPGNRIVGLSLDDLVVFTAASDDETQHTLRRGLPTRTAEARTALRHGHRVAKARLLIAEGSRQWSLVLDGSTMRFGSVKLPEDAEECASAVDRTTDRAANWLALHEIVATLFGQFVRVRVGDGWREEAAAMASWMAS